MTEDGWIAACRAEDFGDKRVRGFDHDGRSFAIFRSTEGEFFATDGRCTHAMFPLAFGFVMEDMVICPRHNCAFNTKTGKAFDPEMCADLRTYPAKAEDGTVYIRIDSSLEQPAPGD